jgi:poly(A) polymerase
MIEYELQKQFLNKKQMPHIGEITMIVSVLIKDVFVHAFSHFPRRISAIMSSILVTQYRLTPLSGRRHYREKLFRHKEFTLALKFLKIRALANEELVEVYTSIRNQYRQIIRHNERKHHSPPPKLMMQNGNQEL